MVDEESKHCICIDPASERSRHEIAYIAGNGLTLDYILLTHEHTDHTWGVNALLSCYPKVNVVCSQLCETALSHEAKIYFQLYYDDSDYSYCVERVDNTIEELGMFLKWQGHVINFIATPGHSPGSIVIDIDNVLFGGDTLMPFKPYIKKRNGGSIEQLRESMSSLEDLYPPETLVYPGHGDAIAFCEIIKYLKK